MSRTLEHQQHAVEFSNRHFERFVTWGGQLLTREVVAVVTGPGRGNVLWKSGRQKLAGHYISTVRRSSFPEDIERFRRFGFTESEQAEGLWVVKPSEFNAKREEIPSGRDHAFVHWDGKSWKVVRSNDDAPTHDEVSGWSAPPSDITEREQQALKRVVQESEVMLDAALTLGEGSNPYFELDRELALRAMANGQENPISILTQPWRHTLSHRLRSSVHQLANIGPALNRSIAGKGVRDSNDLMILHPAASEAVVTDPASMRLLEGTLLPPFPTEWSIFDIPRPE